VFDSIKRALGNAAGVGGGSKARDLRQELLRVQDAIQSRQEQLAEKRATRFSSLFPEGPVEGFQQGSYPGLDPINFEETEPQSWLIATATGIIDNFPGSAGLLSQLDRTYMAFSDANHYRVEPDGPWAELLDWRREILGCWDLDLDVPVYVSLGGGSRVVGCGAPFLILDQYELEQITGDSERRFMLASCLGHVFFGNLKIFAFYRLMEMLDKLPNVTGLITRGIGVLIPQISRGLELARSVNSQVIRKTNLVVGQRQHVLCNRLAALALGDPEVGQRYLARLVLPPDQAADRGVRERLIAQGRQVHERFEAGEIDLTMLSVVGPNAPFAAWRAYRLQAWSEEERSQKLAEGYYVTRSRLSDYRRNNKALEEELAFLEGRLVELAKREQKLQEELLAAEERETGTDEPAAGAEG